MNNIKYEADPHNRLVAGETGKKTLLSGIRRVMTGRFKIDKDSTLRYHVKSPVNKNSGKPYQIRFDGTWSLDKNHDLVYTLNKWGRQTLGNKITIQGKIVDVKKDYLLFAVTTRHSDSVRSAYVLRLHGSWHADENNRLTFKVKRERGIYDSLYFNGIWDIGPNHQLCYKYEKTLLKRKTKKIHTLNFKGHWDVNDRLRISYIMDKDSRSAFSFTASSSIFSAKFVQYTIGVTLQDRVRPVRRVITLFGKWKVNRKCALSFEVEYENRKTRSMTFGAEIKLLKKGEIVLRLKNSITDKDLGINLKISQRLLGKDSELFIKLIRFGKERAILAGAGARW